MTKFAVYGASSGGANTGGANTGGAKSESVKSEGRLCGRLALGFGLTAAVLLLGVANASAGVKASFTDPGSSVQVAAIESQKQLVGTEDLSAERAKGYTPGMLSAPGGDSKVAVILWDDAWSELQRRARSASAAVAGGSNAGTNIAGSSGGRSN